MHSSNQQAEKALLRKTALQKRDRLDQEFRIEAALAASAAGAHHEILENLDPGVIVGGYHPIRSEIDPRPLMAELASRGARLCLPVVIDKTKLEFRELVRGASLVDSGFGTVGPDENAAVLSPEFLLMPLSVFDTSGNRIGYGAGYYDRYIEKLIRSGIQPTLLGMAYSVQQAVAVPAEPHDCPLGHIITENGVLVAADAPSDQKEHKQ